jgi:PPOX class probable F420-dependent enzyme
VDEASARQLFGQSRIARLATIDPQGKPHIVPVVFALVGDRLWSAVDAKPKRTRNLQRLANIEEHPRVSLLVDHYDEDWAALWWVRADGAARVLAPEEDRPAREALARKYPQYRETAPPGPVMEVVIDRWRSWSAAGSVGSHQRP